MTVHSTSSQQTPASALDTTNPLDPQPGHSSSYPVSRLAPAFHAPDLRDQLGRVEAMLSARTSAKLGLIADQIRQLQDSARTILQEAEQEQALHQAECAFERKPGRTYHLYRKADGRRFWSMLSLADWRGQPPHDFAGSYRLEADYSWSPVEDASTHANSS
ncbi:DUF2452 domain-containing protein [Rhabdochromatium marinum]|uniref:DUF2452 domain-containing protein n=1 Tax=Rhabdochromatium marinum TaxID=48729 RepID=UPI0019057AF0|nr:DUF2452 domain-containing protein [Rhabdochromatium marinum]MBK1647976.1 hypothetical protein [Rhabdochromatium marinum]